ncbi:MAG: aminoglycoside 3'-phosphotransferase [Opitutaceae bacterium]|nr:aminoglycoside 3'-phosphotransferase [Opitutaceae bacterium]
MKSLDLKKDFLLPREIEKVLGTGTVEKIPIGESDSDVFRVHRKGREMLYLKVAASAAEVCLKTEVEKLNWLINYVKVPRIIHYEERDGFEYILMSAMEGVPSFSATEDRVQTIKEVARGLLQIHTIPLEECPFVNDLNKKIEEARSRVKRKVVDEDDFDPEKQGRTAEDVFFQVLGDRPGSEDLVVTHGDYCMPNIIIKNGRLNGFIDVEWFGIADRYQDLAPAARSIERNFSKDHVDVFFKEYGIIPNREKIEYFKLLDELF